MTSNESFRHHPRDLGSRSSNSGSWAGIVVRRSVAIVVLGTGALALLWLALPRSATATAALIGVTAVGLGVLVVAALSRTVHALSLYAVFSYAHVLLFVLRPVYNALAQDGINIFTGAPSGTEALWAALLAGGGFISLSLAYGLATASRSLPIGWSARSVRPIPRERWRALLPILAVVELVGVGMYAVYVQQVGGIASYISISMGRSDQLTQVLSGASGYLTSGLLFTQGAALVVFAQGLAARRSLLSLLGLALVVLSVAPQVLSGSRSVFVPIVIALLIVIRTIRPKMITGRRIALLAFPAYLLLIVFPGIARVDASSSGNFLSSLRQALSPQGFLDGFLGGFDTAMFDAFELQVASRMAGNLDLAMGQTYLAGLFSFVPRAIWPGKPQAVDTILNAALFPETAARGIGFSFGFYSEPYFNFGVAGIVVVGTIFGALLGAGDRKFRDFATAEAIALGALVSGALMTVVRGSLSFDLQRILIPLLPALAAIWVTRSAGQPSNRMTARETLGSRTGSEPHGRSSSYRRMRAADRSHPIS